MDYFETSLLRERFILHNMNGENGTQATPIIALSNRIVCALPHHDGTIGEKFVIRGHNMHSCIRMASRIMQAYRIGGLLLNRPKHFDWEETWRPVLNDFERKYNPDRWLTIYHNSKIVFEIGERHPFFDLIEKCDFQNDCHYDKSVKMAEDAFKNTGKNIRIDYDGNIAYVTTLSDGAVRSGIILRDANRTTTFNFYVSQMTQDKPVNLAQCMSAAAAYLEAVQLSFLVGLNSERLKVGLIKYKTPEEQQTHEGRMRLARLNTEISNLETNFNVRYRPERPSFEFMMNNAETLAKKIIEKELKPYDIEDEEEAKAKT